MTHPRSAAQKFSYKNGDEKEDEEERASVVDPAFIEKTKNKAPKLCDKNVFLIASFAAIILELSAALFTLSVIHFKLSRGTVHRVTLAYYAALVCLVSILMVDSIIALGEANDDWNQGKISRKELSLKKTEYIATIASSLMWISLCAASVIMESGYHWNALVKFSLCVSVIAPLTGMFSAFVRAYEVVVSNREQEKRQALAAVGTPEQSSNKGLQHKTVAARLFESVTPLGKVTDDKRHHPSKFVVSGNRKSASLRNNVALCLKSSMFVFVAVFEAAHCLCHVYEAYLLVGNTHQLFFITQKALLYTQAAIALVFLVTFIVEHVLDEKPEVHKEKACLDVVSGCSTCSIVVSGSDLLFTPF